MVYLLVQLVLEDVLMGANWTVTGIFNFLLKMPSLCSTYEKIPEKKYDVLMSDNKKCRSQFNGGLSIFLETIPNSQPRLQQQTV
jgi:hypothetical protein